MKCGRRSLRSCAREGLHGAAWDVGPPCTGRDRAVVDLQSPQFSTAVEVRRVMNLALIPAPWWDWLQFAHPGRSYRTPKAADAGASEELDDVLDRIAVRTSAVTQADDHALRAWVERRTATQPGLRG